jgi:hypothetical protein
MNAASNSTEEARAGHRTMGHSCRLDTLAQTFLRVRDASDRLMVDLVDWRYAAPGQ